MKRICKECFYYRNPPVGLSEKDYATCDATKTLNLVTGEWEYNYCWIERESVRPEACGANAQHYAEPEPHEFFPIHEPQAPVTNWCRDE